MYRRQQGFTLLEALIVVAIVVILAVIIHVSLVQYTRRMILRGGVSQIAALLADARTRTLSGEGGIEYGVHLTSTSSILFQGPTYSATDLPIDSVLLDQRLMLSFTVDGGGSDIVFNRLDGDTTYKATITLSVIPSPALEQTLIIQKTGVVSYN